MTTDAADFLLPYDPSEAPTAEGLGWLPSVWHGLLHDVRSRKGVLPEAQAQLVAAIPVPESDEETPGPVADPAGVIHDSVSALSRGLYAHLYNDPAVAEGGPAWIRAAVKGISDVPEIAEVRDAVKADPDMSAIATATILRAVAEKMPELLEALEDAGVDPQSEDQTAGEGDEDGEGMQAALEDAAEQIKRAVRGAALDAAEEVADAREALNGILPGLGGAPPAAGQEDPRRLELYDRIKGDDRMRKILKVAGRIQRISERVRHVRSDESREEVVDIERGADIGRILPSELAGMAIGGPLQLLALKGIADRSLLQYRLSGHEPLGRGPICVCLDVSSSMAWDVIDGLAPIDWVAAIGIAAVRAGMLQRRAVAICEFNTYLGRTWTLSAKATQKEAEAAIFDLVGISANGGTTFNAPLTWALDKGAEQERADLIFVTDGAADTSSPVVKRLDEAKAKGLRVWGVQVGNGGNMGTLATICTGIATIRPGVDAAVEIGELGAH